MNRAAGGNRADNRAAAPIYDHPALYPYISPVYIELHGIAATYINDAGLHLYMLIAYSLYMGNALQSIAIPRAGTNPLLYI